MNSYNLDNILDKIIQSSDDNNKLDADVNANNKNENNNDNIIEINKNEINENEIVYLTRGWNDKNERMVISIGENSASYKWMHEKSASLYKNIHQVLSILMILFSAGLSAETILPTTNEFIINTSRSVFTYIITLISVLQNFLKYEKLAQQHVASASSFGTLYHDIQQQMCMYRKDRRQASSYISEILKEYDNLIVNGPTITSYIVKDFKNTFRNAEISIPDIADRIQKIEVITEPNNQIVSQSKGLSLAPRKEMPKVNDNEIDLSTISDRNFSSHGICNLQQIHQAFQNHSDTADNDTHVIEMRNLKKQHLNSLSDFEFNRFKHHDSM
jgi:hypothetical protein